jgi:hypothetical protein
MLDNGARFNRIHQSPLAEKAHFGRGWCTAMELEEMQQAHS